MPKRLTRTPSEIHAMRESGQMLAAILQMLKEQTVPNISTKELAEIAAKELRSLGGAPTFLGYYGFPDIICISINNEVVHGIPRADKIISEGDIVSLDFGVTYRGMITDAAISYVLGKAKKKHQQLVSITEKSLYAGLAVLHDGIRTGDLGFAIETVLNKHHYGVVRDLVGHGVGQKLHEDPSIPNYGRPGSGVSLYNNMTIAVEPMATLGTYKVFTANDGWTVLTQDGSWAAHFEHSVLITEKGCEILTALSA
ncbi:MAG TPA: type I methionyl aminopeptidase [Candidatus Saccharimonadales bacterium]|nr:type I methionyl aminopeptidase [Candidatus Saccharimonadales bacterium]